MRCRRIAVVFGENTTAASFRVASRRRARAHAYPLDVRRVPLVVSVSSSCSAPCCVGLRAGARPMPFDVNEMRRWCRWFACRVCLGALGSPVD